MSSYFARILREDPVEAEIDFHKPLVRAGYTCCAAPGIYTWLPLGLQVLWNVENIVREETDRAGGRESQFPVLLPREPHEAANRREELGSGLFKLQGREGGDYLLGPTHEEILTVIIKDLFSSCKDLSILLYQIREKYHDGIWPRAGAIRGRESVMKDLYSFDLTNEGLARSYALNREVYRRVYICLGSEPVICQAQSGAMGGSASEEFLFPYDIDEGTLVRSLGGYATNVEAVITVVPEALSFDDASAPEALPTPDSTTIESLVAEANELYSRKDRPWRVEDTLKDVVVVVEGPDGHSEVIVVGVPGNRRIDMKRLGAALAPVEVCMAESEGMKAFPQLVPGYIGPQVIGSNSPLRSADSDGVINGSPEYLLDPRVVSGTRWITRANEAGKYVFNLVAGWDSKADSIVEAVEVLPSDPAPNGSEPLTLVRGIGIGYTFVLGRKYAKALGLIVLDRDGEAQVVTMDSYGIGVSRLVVAIVENTHDDKGLAWPVNVAPLQVRILIASKDPQVLAAAERLARGLEVVGIPVFYDDRVEASVEVKFRDVELMGTPYLLVMGEDLANGTVEIHDRRVENTLDCTVEAVVEKLLRLIRCELEKTALERTLTELIGESDQLKLNQENGGAVQTSNSWKGIMAFRKIRVVGDPVLHMLCEWTKDPYDPGVKQLVEDLLESVSQEGRTNLAADQIGMSLRAFSWNIDGEAGCILNPKLMGVSQDEYQDGDEGCLSVPNLFYPTERTWYARVEGINLDRRPAVVEGEELMGHCSQHEMDHLEGILYIDKLERKYRRIAL